MLKQYDYPELHIKIGIDEGENVIIYNMDMIKGLLLTFLDII